MPELQNVVESTEEEAAAPVGQEGGEADIGASASATDSREQQLKGVVSEHVDIPVELDSIASGEGMQSIGNSGSTEDELTVDDADVPATNIENLSACERILAMGAVQRIQQVSWILFIGLAFVLAIPWLLVELDGHPKANDTAAVATVMSVLWVTEAVPLAVTALLPAVLFPTLDIASSTETCEKYLNDALALFFGGFVVARAMEKTDLHSRLGLKILVLGGNRPASIILAAMVATAFLSMWISNSATASLMVPIMMSLLTTVERNMEEEDLPEVVAMELKKKFLSYSHALLMGVAFAASVGGTSTLIGTGPNLILLQDLEELFPTAPEISFLQWMLFAIPIACCLVAFIWLFFIIFYVRALDPLIARLSSKKRSNAPKLEFDPDVFKVKYAELGPISWEQLMVTATVLVMVILWLTRLGLGEDSFFSGWGSYLPDVGYGTVALATSVALFMIPTPGSEWKESLLDWDEMKKFPWGVIVLLGGGFSLAYGFNISGLNDWIATQLIFLERFPILVVIIMICSVTTFLTELTSNVAVINIFLPISAALAESLQENPLLLMLPCTLCASMAFMFPVATPPNAIVFSSGVFRVSDMAKPGFIFNLAAITTISLGTLFWGGIVFGIEVGEVPDWA